jgi:DNA-3-methyladenine glycosylase I
LTILRKREAYRRVFHNFDVDVVAAMTQEDVERLLQEEDAENTRNIIVRHRGKIEAVINNAKCIQQMRKEEQSSGGNDDDKQGNHGVLDSLVWSFVQDQPLLNRWKGQLRDVPSQTAESQAMSKALKKLGFKFVGPTTCYAMMQSLGMVIDHPVDSEWKAAQERLKKRPGGYQERLWDDNKH